jgi:tRNA nucleotidyltransferase (CCA-adding enzyme)
MNRIFDTSPLGRLLALALRRAGYQVYVVGGAVRDLFLQREPNDIDIATNMPATEMCKLTFTADMFEEANVEPAQVTFIPLGVDFGVCAFAMNGEVIEVANFRLDLAFDGRHRGVTVGVADTIEEDLVRRDFTMNAMALDPFEEDDEKALLDPFGGRDDIARGVIDTPGSPEMSFEQDALRVLRAVRFMAKFGFAIDPALIEAARKRLVRKRFRLLSPERIRDELVKILEVEDGKSVATAFTVLQEMRILELFMPELSALADLPYRKEYHTEDPFGHTLLALSYTEPDVVLRMAVLGHDFGKVATLDPSTFATPGHARVSRDLVRALMKRFKMYSLDVAAVVHLVDSHMDSLSDGKPHKRLKRSGFFDFGPEHLERGKLVRQADLLGKTMDVSERLAEVEAVFAELKDMALSTPSRSVKELPVNGHDVMRIKGYKPGPPVGAVLNDLFERVVNGELPEDRRRLLAVMEVEQEKESLPFD